MIQKRAKLDLTMVVEVVVHDGFGVFLCLGSEVFVQDIEREFGRIDADPTESSKDACTAAVLRTGDRLEILPPVVGCDTVLVVDTRLIERTHPREIDGMVNKDAFVMTESVLEIQIFGFAVCVWFAVFSATYACQCFPPIGIDTYADSSTMTVAAIEGDTFLRKSGNITNLYVIEEERRAFQFRFADEFKAALVHSSRGFGCRRRRQR